MPAASTRSFVSDRSGNGVLGPGRVRFGKIELSLNSAARKPWRPPPPGQGQIGIYLSIVSVPRWPARRGPSASGGAIDVIGRIYATCLGEALDETWVVENRSGANNTLGAAEVARSAPDGTTPLVNADIHLMACRVMRAEPTTRSRTSRPSPAWQPPLWCWLAIPAPRRKAAWPPSPQL
nr:tripartite tricarboxylate transporter substrate-binding protein [Roseomonas sp. KE2513]